MFPRSRLRVADPRSRTAALRAAARWVQWTHWIVPKARLEAERLRVADPRSAFRLLVRESCGAYLPHKSRWQLPLAEQPRQSGV